MFFVTNNEKLLEKYDSICTKKSNIIGKKNGKQPVYGRKYLNTKLKPNNGKINTESHYICLTGILNFVCKIKRSLTSITNIRVWKSVNMKKKKQGKGRGT